MDQGVEVMLIGDIPESIELDALRYTRKLIDEHEHCFGPLTSVFVRIIEINHVFECRTTLYRDRGCCEHKVTFSRGTWDSQSITSGDQDANLRNNSEQDEANDRIISD